MLHNPIQGVGETMANKIKKKGALPGNTNAQRGAEPLDGRICFRCTTKEQAAIEAKARKAGLPAGRWARQVCLKALKP